RSYDVDGHDPNERRRGPGIGAYEDACDGAASPAARGVNILVCVKRVPQTGGRIVLTADGQAIDTRFLGATVSPHEECGVEEAVRIVEKEGGTSAVLTLGAAEAEEQLRDAMAIGIDRAILLETEGREWDPVSTATAIAETIETQEAANGRFDLILFGNEAADTGDFQVGVRVAT